MLELVVDKPLPFLIGCLYEESRTTSIAAWASPLVFESVVMLLTVIRAIKHDSDGLIAHKTLVAVLYRDGFLYYFVITAITFLNLIIYLTLPLQLSGAIITIYRAVLSILASRLILNVHSAIDSRQSVNVGFSNFNFERMPMKNLPLRSSQMRSCRIPSNNS